MAVNFERLFFIKVLFILKASLNTANRRLSNFPEQNVAEKLSHLNIRIAIINYQNTFPTFFE